MRYFEIVRLENQGFDQEDFQTVKKLVDRGWVNKAHEFLQQWNYGGENIAAAMANGTVRDTVLDEDADTVVKSFPFSDGTYYLCKAKDRVYEAYYLVGETE